ncbi:PREDICTED: pheromone-processing carboxypeptidase KEX1-like [Atta cephalotes]|uniref:Uncharacterized protein n=1 Tax=Atta cephalotes TaxID=12957 RepID=A0A158NTL1_ATTCE|nr:PREDICTED: pheromone-processing carboxypeptidase KEX1-like [Atta cephalotes]
MAPERQTRGVRNHSGEKEKGGVRRGGKEERKREKEKERGNDDSDADSSSDSSGVNRDDNDDADDDDNGNNVYHERRSHRTREKNL